MISYSNPTPHRTVCKYCRTAPIFARTFSDVDFGAENLIQHVKQFTNFKPMIINIDEMEFILDNRRRLSRIKINYYSHLPGTLNGTRFIRKKSVPRDINMKNMTFPKYLRCKCGKSYWIIYSLDKKIFPENNRKSEKYFTIKKIK